MVLVSSVFRFAASMELSVTVSDVRPSNIAALRAFNCAKLPDKTEYPLIVPVPLIPSILVSSVVVSVELVIFKLIFVNPSTFLTSCNPPSVPSVPHNFA